MDNKVSVPVFVTVVLVALSIGFLGGYFVHSQVFMREWSVFQNQWKLFFDKYKELAERREQFEGDSMRSDTGSDTGFRSSRQEVVRRDIIYHEPSSEPSWGPLNKVEEGNGEVRGTITIGNKDVSDLKFALILGNGQRTPVISPDENGDYRVSIKPDTYFFQGIAIYNRGQTIHRKLLVNKVGNHFGQGFSGGSEGNGDSRMEKFEELAEEFGPEEAAKRLAKETGSIIKQQNRFQFKLRPGGTVELPAFRYQKPVQVVAPQGGSSVSRDNLKFIWKAYPGAESYALSVNKVEKQGQTTSYHGVVQWDDITTNAVSLEEVLDHQVEHSFGAFGPDRSSDEPPFQSGERYIYQIIAYDDDGNVLSATSEAVHNGIQFSIK